MALAEVQPTPAQLAEDRVTWAPGGHACTTCGVGPLVAVDAGALSEVQGFIRELRPMLDQLQELEARWVELQPFLEEMRPTLVQLGAAVKEGPAAMLGFLMGRRPAPPAPPVVEVRR